MRVVVTGGAGFIGRAVVARLADRGDDVVALVRDTSKAAHLKGNRVSLVVSDLTSVPAMTAQMRDADAVIHAAGQYRVGIKPAERPNMWEANVGATQRVLDAAIAAQVPRIVYVSTVGIFGDTHGVVVDETYERDLAAGFLSCYDETKYRAHEEARRRVAAGAPIIFVQPSQVYGPNDHSLTSAQIEQAYHGKLGFAALTNSGAAWVHVEDLSAGIVAALDKGQVGEAYILAGECTSLQEAIHRAARLGGHRSPRVTLPTGLLRLVAPVNDRLGGLPGMPANLREVIRAGDGVTYWAKHDKATRELGFAPRTLEDGIADTWGTSAATSAPERKS